MNIFKQGGIVALIMGSIFILLSFNGKNNTINNNSEDINLAIRQAIHHMLMIEDDSTTTIPPAWDNLKGEHQLKIEKQILYDTLPFLLNQAFLDYNITDPYTVAIKSCEGDSILLGYNFTAFGNGQIPCSNRELESGCNILSVKFPPKEEKANIFLSLGLIGLFGGMVGIFIPMIFVGKQEEEIKIDQKETETILIGSSIFDPKNLTIAVNGKEQTLTFRESKILKYFADHKNEVLKRVDIEDFVWSSEGTIVGRSLDVFISRLRKILKADATLSIKNIHGIGYRLEEKK